MAGTNYQTPRNGAETDRKDHVWIKLPPKEGKAAFWKCCLCGAITDASRPPAYPTPREWLPLRFAALTEFERDQDPLYGPAPKEA